MPRNVVLTFLPSINIELKDSLTVQCCVSSYVSTAVPFESNYMINLLICRFRVDLKSCDSNIFLNN